MIALDLLHTALNAPTAMVKQHDEVPVEDMNLELLVAFDRVIEEIAQTGWPAVRFFIPYEFQPAVDVPGHDQNGPLSLFYRFPESTKKIGSIHDKSGSICMSDTPAVIARLQDG